jgi:hypothetical protein
VGCGISAVAAVQIRVICHSAFASACWVSGRLIRGRGEHLLAGGLGRWRGAWVVAEDLVGARDDMRVCVDLVKLAGHPQHLPVAAERGRVEQRRRAQLRMGDPARNDRRRVRGRGAEDGVPEHRLPREVDGGLILLEGHDMSGGQFVQHQRLRGWVVTVLAESVGQPGGTGDSPARAAAQRPKP